MENIWNREKIHNFIKIEGFGVSEKLYLVLALWFKTLRVLATRLILIVTFMSYIIGKGVPLCNASVVQYINYLQWR